jgi:hypothetical protein
MVRRAMSWRNSHPAHPNSPAVMKGADCPASSLRPAPQSRSRTVAANATWLEGDTRTMRLRSSLSAAMVRIRKLSHQPAMAGAVYTPPSTAWSPGCSDHQHDREERKLAPGQAGRGEQQGATYECKGDGADPRHAHQRRRQRKCQVPRKPSDCVAARFAAFPEMRALDMATSPSMHVQASLPAAISLMRSGDQGGSQTS